MLSLPEPVRTKLPVELNLRTSAVVVLSKPAPPVAVAPTIPPVFAEASKVFTEVIPL